MNKSELQTLRGARGELLETAKEIRDAHTYLDNRDDWSGEYAAKKDYDRMMTLARGLGRIIARYKQSRGGE